MKAKKKFEIKESIINSENAFHFIPITDWRSYKNEGKKLVYSIGDLLKFPESLGIIVSIDNSEDFAHVILVMMINDNDKFIGEKNMTLIAHTFFRGYPDGFLAHIISR